MPIYVGNILIPDEDLSVAFVRAGGPGGQNVNKVSSAVQLRFALNASQALSPAVKNRLRALAGRRVTDDGSLLIIARSQRSQEQNRREAEQRLADLIRAAAIEPKTRRATRPTLGSKVRRLEGKTRRSTVKRGRSRVSADD
jgi:ribosome-associated protein